MFTRFRFFRRSLLVALSVVLLAGTAIAVQATQAGENAVRPTCCMKKAYCCQVKARCCNSGESVEAAVIPVSIVQDEAAKPPCCVQRADCCTFKLPCCGLVVAEPDQEVTASPVTSNTCCAKKAYCCKVKSPCCSKE